MARGPSTVATAVRSVVRPPPPPRFLFAAIAAVTLIGGGTGLAAVTWLDRTATVADWTSSLALSARLVETRIRGLQVEVNAHLLRLDDRLADRPPASLRGSDADRQWLESVRTAIPGAIAIGIHDDKADLVLTTDRRGVFTANAAGQDFVAPSLAQPGKTVISAMTADSAAPARLIVFSRAMVDRAGRVGGIAEILIDPALLVGFFSHLQPPDQGSVFTIIRMDGSLIARQPVPDGSPARLDTTQSPFTEFTKASTGAYRAVSVIDGAERLVSFRRLPDLDLVVTAGMTTDMVFRDWATRTRRNAAWFAIGILLLLALTTVAREGLRHETRLLRSVEQKAAELADALAEKDVLFQEVHHRVKNNLQVISSLLTMQSLHVNDDTARATLKDALDRIHSMGLVHQTLYERNLAANVDLGIYFGRLAEALVGSYGPGKGSVAIQVDVTGSLDLDRAVPLGMLANEAMSNALKHAFPDGRSGTIAVSLTRDDSQWHFTVRDDGIGLPSHPGKGIGLSLIRALTRQLSGRSAISKDGGTVVIVTFPV